MIQDLVKSSINTEEGLSPSLMARIIKFCLLSLRQEDIARRQQEQVSEAQREKGLRESTPKKDKQGEKATPGDAGNKAKASKGKPGNVAGEEAIPMPVKTDSEMKKRKDDTCEPLYIDDEPSWGPDAYVIIHGTLMPGLFVEMANIGAPVGCLLKFCCDEIEDESKELEQDEIDRRAKLNYNLTSCTESNVKSIESSNETSPLRELGCVWLSSELRRCDNEGNTLSGPPFYQDVYNELSDKVYQMMEEKYRHTDYLKCLKLSNLPLNLDKQAKHLG